MWKSMTSIFFTASLLVFSGIGSANNTNHSKHSTKIEFNETFIKGLHEKLPVDNPMQIFEYIFKELKPKVFVYPTENYYYFKFNSNGQAYAGNFRLSLEARKNRHIHFAYFDISDAKWFRHLYLGTDVGVEVTQVDPLIYDVKYREKTVTFVLNNLSQEPPNKVHMDSTERFVGRSFDESGVKFLLLYNDTIKSFIWVLDEEMTIPYQLVPLHKELSIDLRTSFVFYTDAKLKRSVLAGVSLSNSIANNYFDGPFDQLPDNYIEDTSFAEFVEQAYPKTKGMLNRRGEHPDGKSRLAITPYRQYGSTQELISHFSSCEVLNDLSRAAFYSCMFYDYKKRFSD